MFYLLHALKLSTPVTGVSLKPFTNMADHRHMTDLHSPTLSVVPSCLPAQYRAVDCIVPALVNPLLIILPLIAGFHPF